MTDGVRTFNNALAARFSGYDMSPGGEVWVRFGDALEAVRLAEQRGLRILGMEGFVVGGSGVYPAMSRVSDWSTASPAESYVLARGLLTGASVPPPDVPSDAGGEYVIDLVVSG